MVFDNDWNSYRRRAPDDRGAEEAEGASKRTGAAAVLGKFELFQGFPEKVVNRFFRNAVFLIISTMVLVACFPFILAALLGPSSPSASAYAPGRDGDSSADEFELPEGTPPLPPGVSLPRPESFRTVLQRIRSGSYATPSEVASGTFLGAFDLQAIQLESLDEWGLCLKRWGKRWRWVILEAPYRSFADTGRTARLRFEKHGGDWKLEAVRVVQGDEREAPGGEG